MCIAILLPASAALASGICDPARELHADSLVWIDSMPLYPDSECAPPEAVPKPQAAGTGALPVLLFREAAAPYMMLGGFVLLAAGLSSPKRRRRSTRSLLETRSG